MATPAFPLLSSGSVAKYPLTRSRIRRGTILIFTDFSEQRFQKGSPLDGFDLVFTKIPTADKERVRAFWDSMQGPFVTDFDFTLNNEDGSSVTYHFMQFTPGQQFEPIEETPNRWTFSLKLRKTRKD
jgi:hypothetical protein